MSKTSSALIALGVVAGLGAAALPLSSYAADELTESAQVGVTLTIEDELTIEADKDTTDNNKVDLSGEGNTGDVVLTVVSNNTTGYNLAIKGSGANPTTLKSENGDEIVAGSGSFDTPAALSTTTSEWGYRLASFTAGEYAGVKSTDQIIKTTTTPTVKTGETTTVTFGASIKDGQPAGTYNGEVTFTATNNAKN